MAHKETTDEKIHKLRNTRYYDSQHLGCPSYPNCDEDPYGCTSVMGDKVNWYGHKDQTMINKESILAKIEVKLLDSGDVVVGLDYVQPELLITAMDEHAPDHENTHLYAAMIRYIKDQYHNIEDGLEVLIKNVN